jgi:hypothetical protein
MAEEINVHQKVAMADVFGCLTVGFVAFAVSMLGFNQGVGGAGLILVLLATGICCLIVTLEMFKNENILGTAIFGPLTVSFLAYSGAATGFFGPLLQNELAIIIGFTGVVLLIDFVLSLLQPVKMLSVVLVIAGIAYMMLAYWLSLTTHPAVASDTLRTMWAVFFLLLSITATYLGTAVVAFVMKGKPILPLLIMAPKK